MKKIVPLLKEGTENMGKKGNKKIQGALRKLKINKNSPAFSQIKQKLKAGENGKSILKSIMKAAPKKIYRSVNSGWISRVKLYWAKMGKRGKCFKCLRKVIRRYSKGVKLTKSLWNPLKKMVNKKSNAISLIGLIEKFIPAKVQKEVKKKPKKKSEEKFSSNE